GPLKEDRATWTEPMVHIKEAYSEPVFQACNTERLADVVEDLVGRGRWRSRGQPGNWGWWPVNFALGADQPWDVPTSGWHYDGQHFRHFVDAPDQGLLLLCVFSEVQPQGGGTLVAEGSHWLTARVLAQHPDGMEHQEVLRLIPQTHPWLAELMGRVPPANSSESRRERFMERTHHDPDGTALRVVETTARPGDVFLCHPFLYHAPSQNHRREPRFMCNRTTPLKERMQLNRPDGDYSPVEISIRMALAASHSD
ncbi:MAG: hypothetical protein C4321_05200, partial [Chloroflexota bacterium]